MDNFKFWKTSLIILVIFSSYLVNGQNDTLIAQSDSIYQPDIINSFNYSLFKHLPFTGTNDIFQLNPVIYRNEKDGGHLINGFYTSGDYTWFDGVPMDFTEEMPLRLIGQARFDDFNNYLKFNNSISGFAALEPVKPSDSLTFLVETSSRLIYKKFNDADLQLLFSGPLIKKKSGYGNKSVLNFTVAGRLFSSADSDPSYVLRNHAAADYLEYLQDEPLRPNPSGGTYENACYTTATDAVSSWFNTNAEKKGYSLYGNLRADLQNGMFIKFGTYTVDKNEVIPIYENYFFNQDNNPERSTLYSTNYILFGQEIESKGLTRFTYQVQGQYSLMKTRTEDPDHGSRLFEYGYVGKFDTYKSPTFELGSDTVNGNFYDQAWILNSWDYDTLVEFTPGNMNTGLAAYTSSYFSIYNGETEGNFENLDQVQMGGGLLNGRNPTKVYGLWNNTGTNYNAFSVDDQRRINIMANGLLELGKHKISLGFQFKKDNYSSYQANPMGLWTLMRSLANFHIRELDQSHPYIHEGEPLDSIFYYRKFDAVSQYNFDKNLREALGLDPEGVDFIDIDSYDYKSNTINVYDKDGVKHTIDCGEELLSMDKFSADELLNDGIASYVSCNGYDYLGNRIRDKVSFEDFFDAKNEEGAYIRPVGAYTPMNYSAFAGYHLDFRDWSVDAGIRMDAFDSHQQVLKDPYLFYEAYTVGELEKIPGFSFEPPDGIGNDYIVYVDNGFNPTQVTGFREGDLWYDDEGNKISDPEVLDVGSGISPYLKYPEQERISTSVFTRNKTYFNFLPQIHIQKTFNDLLAISFSYNSAVINPNHDLTFSNPAVYYFIENNASWVPNGSLEPERTDKIRAALSVMPIRKLVITAGGFLDYYSNMIYLIRRVGAYPKDYWSYYNEDDPFAQYGFDVSINGRSLKLSGFGYGLSYHFIINKDNPAYHVYDFRVPKNLVKGYLQFNTGFGKDYLGPSGSVNYTIFSGLGIGLFGQFQSGIYYMSTRNPDGSSVTIYKSEETMPGQAFLDLKIEKGFQFKNSRYNLILYCMIQNLFNTEVVYKVYRFTGQPDDNGFLTAPESQQLIAEALDEESFRYLYASYINDPSNYGLPRRTSFGISFDF
jgi:hypothetical protein